MDTIDEIIKQIDFQGNIYEVAVIKELEPLRFTIDVEASKATPYAINNNKLAFPNDYIIKDIITLAETNALAGFMFKIGGIYYPKLWYFLDASNELSTKTLGTYSKLFYCTNSGLTFYQDLNIEISKDSNLEFYVYNTHTSAQEIYIDFIGYKVFRKIIKQLT